MKDGGSAFPIPMITQGEGFYEVSSGGMSLRDWFAGQWLHAAANAWANTAPDKLALEAYAIADAMLEAREQS
jgi:hypothetical protein